ncbi:MAG: Rho termination factor N-terminal domain-containing protein, partial [Lachnospiraceae bacterium]|nr:Rho termination factor N-terminal domain-containing protein [Lachnospiraceae bacterium]
MTREMYESLALTDLKAIAKKRGMKRTTGLKKAELIDAMMAQDVEDAKAAQEERARAAQVRQEERAKAAQTQQEERGRGASNQQPERSAQSQQ